MAKEPNDNKRFRLYDRLYRICKRIVCPVICRFLRFHGEPLPQTGGPALIMCNHNTDLDFLLLVSSFPGIMDFVATENVARMGFFGRFAAKHLHPILHDKGSVGLGTVREIVNRIKSGRSVLLFPEGNRSFDGRTCPITPATGGLARVTGCTLILYKLTGGYLTSPRWGKGFRKGRMEGHVAGVFTPEELKAMTSDEVQAEIEKALRTDAYEEQADDPVPFRSRHGAEFLESVLFLCPSCAQTGTLISRGNDLSCSSCGQKMTYTAFGRMQSPDGKEYTVTELLNRQAEHLADRITEPDSPLFSDPLTCRRIDSAHNILDSRDITLTAYAGHLTLDDEILPADRISDITIVQRNRLSIHPKNSKEHYELLGSGTFNALKYRLWKELTAAKARE